MTKLLWDKGGGGGGGGEEEEAERRRRRDTESKTRTPHKDVGNESKWWYAGW